MNGPICPRPPGTGRSALRWRGAAHSETQRAREVTNDERYQGGYWIPLDVDLSKVSSKAIRVNISLPENLVQAIDALAKVWHMSRSAFLAAAAKHAKIAVALGITDGQLDFQLGVKGRHRTCNLWFWAPTLCQRNYPDKKVQ